MRSIARNISSWNSEEVGVALRKSHRLYAGPECDIRVAKAHRHYGKILVSVKRQLGTAPERNRFKRRMKSLFYQEHFFEKGFDWIVFAKKNGLITDFCRLKEIVQSVAGKL